MQFIADIFPILGVSIIYHQDRNIIKPRANNQGIHSSFQDPAGSRPERVMQGTQFAPKAKSQKKIQHRGRLRGSHYFGGEAFV